MYLEIESLNDTMTGFYRIISLLIIITVFINSVNAVYFKSVGPDKGLAHPAVISIFQDKLGRIWFGTEEGLSIYDGNTISTYKPYSLSGNNLFEGNIVLDITSDINGDVYFRTEKGVVKHTFKTGRFDMLSYKYASALYSNSGNIWIAENDSLLQWNPYMDKFVYMSPLPKYTVNAMCFDNSGNKWFATDKGVYVSNDYGEIIPFRGIDSEAKCVSMIQGSNGELWVASQNRGIYRVINDGEIVNYSVENCADRGMASNDVRQILEDGDNLWFGTYKGLHRYNKKSDSFTVYSANENKGDMQFSSVYSVLKDNEGMIWVGTYFGGAYTFSPENDIFAFYSTSNGMSHPLGGDMVEDDKGHIWVCTEGGGINCITTDNKKVVPIRDVNGSLPFTNPKSIVYNKDKNELYIGTNKNGLFSYNPETRKFKNLIKPKSINDSLSVINVVKQIDYKTLCLSSNNGVFVYDINSEEVKRIYTPDVPFSFVHVDKQKRIWILEYNSIAVLSFGSFDVCERYNLSDDGLKGRIIRLLETSDGNIYLGTYGSGVMKLNRDTRHFESFPKITGTMLSSYCYRLAEVDESTIVVTGDRGMAILGNSGDIIRIRKFNESIPIDAFNRDCGLVVTADKNIYAGGTNGIAVFKYTENEKAEMENRLYFSSLYVDNKKIEPNDASGILYNLLPYTDEITVGYEDTKLDISIAASNIISERNNFIYEYKFSGYGDKWFQIVDNVISFPFIDPGKYSLDIRIKGTNPISKLSIIVLPPWYKTWWAWTIWFSLGITIFVITFRIILTRRRLDESIRKEKMEKEQIIKVNEAKFRFFTNVSHEFRTPLTLIISQLQLLCQNFNHPPRVQGKLLKVMEQAKTLNDLITELIDFRKYEQNQMSLTVNINNINEFISHIIDNFKEQAEKQNIKLELKKLPQEKQGWFDNKQMKKVFYNLLSNALKYTPGGGNICVGIGVYDGILEVKISDSGIGIDKKDIKHIFDRFYQAENGKSLNVNYDASGIGLALVKTIVERHQGKVSVISEKGYGTVFTVEIPIDKAIYDNMENVIIEKEYDAISDESPELSYKILEDNKKIFENDVEKPNIVIVEDNEELNDVMVQIFSPLYNVKSAFNGKEGLEIIRTTMPDLVISDIMMPEMDGKQMCQKVKENIELCHIPVVLLTALNMKEQVLEGLLCGADDYICKPFDSRILLAKCNNIINARRISYDKKQKIDVNEQKLSSIATSELDVLFIDKVEKIIEENIESSDFDIDFLSQKIGMSRSVFYNKFKTMTGQTPNDYLMKLRLKKAAVLLKENPDLSISDISDKLGFGSLSYFCRKFKDFYGVSPKQFVE